jgi:uncharacterized protein YxjI
VGTIGKSLGFVREMIYIRGLNWIIVGNMISNRYKVFHGASLIFSLSPIRYANSDYHELIVENPEDEPISIVIASVLDHWARKKDPQQKRSFRNNLSFHAEQSLFSNLKNRPAKN